MRNNQNRMGAPGPPPGADPAFSMVYNVPTEFVDLPSRGMFYPEGHPLCGKSTIEIKYMTAKEEDILSSTNLIKNGMAVSRFLESIVVEEAITPDSLLIGDRNAIMVAARKTAYGPAYEVEIVCNFCEQKTNNHMFDLDKAQMVDKCFDNNYLNMINCEFDDAIGLFTVELPNSKVSVGLKLLTGHDQIQDDENKVITTLLNQFVVSANGDQNPAVVRSFVENMPAGDSRFLRKIYVELVPNIDLSQEFMCQHCGKKETREVPLSAEFFWPN